MIALLHMLKDANVKQNGQITFVKVKKVAHCIAVTAILIYGVKHKKKMVAKVIKMTVFAG